VYATILRCGGAGSADGAVRAGRPLTAALGGVPGFVSLALLDAGQAGLVLVAVLVCEDEADLAAADRLVVRWAAEHLDGPLSHAAEVAIGEVIVQRGL